MSANPDTFTVRGTALANPRRTYEITWRRRGRAIDIEGNGPAVFRAETIRQDVIDARLGVGLIIDRYRTGFDPYTEPEYALAVFLSVIDPATAEITGYDVPTYDLPEGAIG